MNTMLHNTREQLKITEDTRQYKENQLAENQAFTEHTTGLMENQLT